jgi:DNA primase
MTFGELFPLEEYYQKKIKPMGGKFYRRKSGKIVCPFHEDEAPSMGFLHNKDGSEIYHCFGCGAKGDVVKMHQQMELVYHDRRISRNEAIKELCTIFGKDFAEVQKELDLQEDKKLKDALTVHYKEDTTLTERDFTRKVFEGKAARKGIDYYNELVIQMIQSNAANGEGVK